MNPPPSSSSPVSAGWRTWALLGVVGLLPVVAVLGYVLYPQLNPPAPATTEPGAGKDPPKPKPQPPQPAVEAPEEMRFPWQPPELVAVLGTHRGRHWYPVRHVALSDDGKVLASAALDDRVRLWHPETLRELHSFPGTACAVSADGRQVLTCGEQLRIWDASTAKEIRRCEGSTQGHTLLTCSADGRTAVSCSGNAHEYTAVYVWDLVQGKQARQLQGHGSQVFGVALSRDGRQVAASDGNGIRIWDAATGKLRHAWQGGAVARLVFTAKGERLLSGGEATILWDTVQGQEIRRWPEKWCDHVALTADDRLVVSCETRQVHVWELESGTTIRTFVYPHLTGHYGWDRGRAAVSADGKRVLASNGWPALYWWDVAAGQPVCPDDGHRGVVSQVAFTPDGKQLLSASPVGEAVLWDLADSRSLCACRVDVRSFFIVALSPNGKRIVSDAGTGSLSLWQLPSGELVRSFGFPKTARNFTRIVWLPDGYHMLMLGAEQGAGWLMAIWNTATGEKERTFEISGEQPLNAAVTTDGRQVVTIGGEGDRWCVQWWDRGTGKKLRTVKIQGGFPFFAGDARRVALVDGLRVHIWSLATDPPFEMAVLTGHQVVSLVYSGNSLVHDVAFTPDGNTVASAGADGKVMVWSVAGEKKLHEWQLPGPVASVAFSPDGRLLAVGNCNGTVYLLDLQRSAKK